MGRYELRIDFTVTDQEKGQFSNKKFASPRGFFDSQKGSYHPQLDSRVLALVFLFVVIPELDPESHNALVAITVDPESSSG